MKISVVIFIVGMFNTTERKYLDIIRTVIYREIGTRCSKIGSMIYHRCDSLSRERERERVTLSKRNRSSELDINPSGKGDWLKISN